MPAFIVAVLLTIAVPMAICQTKSPKSVPELRDLLKRSQSKDEKTSAPAIDELSKLTADSSANLFQIVQSDPPCTAATAAGTLIKLTPSYPGLVPAITKIIGTNPGSEAHWEEDGLCRRLAGFLLPETAEGLRSILNLLKSGNVWEKQAAVFALDDFTEVDAYMDRAGEIDVMMEIVPALAKLQKSKDEVVAGMSNEVLGQISRGPDKKLANLAKKLLAD